MNLNNLKSTVITEPMGVVYLRIDPQHARNIWAFNKELIEHLLSHVIEFIGDNSSFNSPGIVALFPDSSIEHFSKPPNTIFIVLVLD